MRITSARIKLQPDLAGHLLDRLPAKLGVGNGARAAHESDAPVPQLMQMQQRLLHRQVMIQNDVGYVFNRAVG